MPEPTWQSEGVRLYLGDCQEIMAGMQPNSIDAIVTDPPYNVGKVYGKYTDDLPIDVYLAWLRSVYGEVSRLSRDALVFFPGTRRMFDIKDMLKGTGLEVVRVLGWHKKEFAGDLWAGGPAMCWEPIIWASKCEHPFFNRIYGTQGRDFLVVLSTHGNPYKGPHPCPKPLPVMKWLLNLFVPRGGSVLDPFMGSGTTGVACVQTGRNFIGVEIDATYFEIARKRIEETQLQMRLPLPEEGR